MKEHHLPYDSEFLAMSGYLATVEEPPAELCRRLLRTLTDPQFAKGKVTFWAVALVNVRDDLRPEKRQELQHRFRHLGELLDGDVLDRVRPDVTTITVAGHHASFKERYEDFNWYVQFDCADHEGVDLPAGGYMYPVRDACFRVGVNRRLLWEPAEIEVQDINDLEAVTGVTCGNTASLRLPRRVADEFDKMGCNYAAFDVDRDPEIRGGFYYSGPTTGRMHWLIPDEFSWRRELNRNLWLMAGDNRRSLVRDIYWGQYFGPALARRFDADGSFGTSFRSTEFVHAKAPSPIYHEYTSGGLFITLTADPMDMAYDEGLRMVPARSSSVGVAAVLHRQLRASNLLI
jgi:hypothetical protein